MDGAFSAESPCEASRSQSCDGDPEMGARFSCHPIDSSRWSCRCVTGRDDGKVFLVAWEEDTCCAFAELLVSACGLAVIETR